ncbi:MAG: tRNA pseudouridine(55) synthase TruB [Verrucomicrobiales bacterium]|nr:tRNA pseudouridine(55) synthase TruB [Verrucomicrobiales bacterium]|tara:strand:+ start:3505 stop:4218 length:714 start_codon:yes stop_codon:yes gene_type:complete
MKNVDGVLLVDKDPDMTSHDVVAVARKTLGQKKIGHCGTLDPMATGLLILTLGKGTKIQDLLMAEDKEYVGTVKLGEETTTQDKQGEIVSTKDVPELSDEDVISVLEKFKGDFYQTPPMVSAIKKDGVPLYKLARQGKEVKRDPRLVHVYDYELTSFNLPNFDFRVVCSKGFYVRTYAHEIGSKIGCGAHLSALRRTKSGKFSANGAVTFSELKNGTRESVASSALSLAEVSRLRGV